MIIHLGGGIRAAGEDAVFLRKIVSTIYDEGDSIARNWVETSYHNANVKRQDDSEVDWGHTAAENDEAIRRADAFIAEVTSYRLYHGYELAHALQQNKPVLLVSRKPFNQFAISGVQNDLLTMCEYSTQEELGKIVAEFLDKNRMPSDKKTVEVTLDLELYRYLKQQEINTGRATSDILYELAKRGLKNAR